MRQNLSGSTGMRGEAWAAGAEPSSCGRNGSACGGGVQHVPATARGRRRLDYVNHGGQGAAAPYPAGGASFVRR
jgi:hypothetical protein